MGCLNMGVYPKCIRNDQLSPENDDSTNGFWGKPLTDADGKIR